MTYEQEEFIYRQYVYALIQLLETQPDLFSEHYEACGELPGLLGENKKQSFDALKAWCKTRPEIFRAHMKFFENLSNRRPYLNKGRGAGGASPPPLPSSEELREELREELINALRRYRPSNPSLVGKPRGDKNNPIKG